MTKYHIMIVGDIVDQGDRVLIKSAADPQFYVITSQLKSAGIRRGDTVTYEEGGMNFGWLISSQR